MRVLIATVTAGAGHLQAAAALEEAWRDARPRDAVERLDVLEFTSKFYRKVYTEGYVKFVERAPELWGMFFKKTDDPALVRLEKLLGSPKLPEMAAAARRLGKPQAAAAVCREVLARLVGQASSLSPHHQRRRLPRGPDATA